MSKYSRLRIFLQNSKNVSEVITFQELEIILGSELPPSASIRTAWWGNEVSKNSRHTHCREWLNAGWIVENVCLGDKVTFKKIN